MEIPAGYPPLKLDLAPRNESPPIPTPTILIDRCPLFREGLKRVLGGSRFTIVASEADIKDVRPAEDGADTALLIVLVSSPDFADDLEALKAVRTRFPGGRVVSLRRDCTRLQAAMLLRAGTAAILLLASQSDGLIEALELVMMGQHVMPLHLMGCCAELDRTEIAPLVAAGHQRTEAAGGDSKLSRLSTREIEIVQCLLAGEPNRSIARRLTISEATVKVHVKAILRKIKVKNRTQAAIWALNNIEGRMMLVAAPIIGHVMDHLAALRSLPIA